MHITWHHWKNVCISFTHRISLTLLNIFVVIYFVCSISNLVVIDQCWNQTAVDLFDKFHNKFYELLCALSSHWHQILFYTVCCARCTAVDIELYWNVLCTFLFTFSWFCWCYYFIVCTSTAIIHTLRTKSDVINCVWLRCCFFFLVVFLVFWFENRKHSALTHQLNGLVELRYPSRK